MVQKSKDKFKGQKAFLGWIGGKSRLVEQLLPLIPPHETYVEVFAGAAWLLFRKPASRGEVINDINRELVTLYRVVQHHLPELLRQFQHTLVSREEFERLRSVDPDTLTDVQRAARFYYLMRGAFGSKLVGQTFGLGKATKPRFNPDTIVATLDQAQKRLKNVFVENLGYEACIKRLDSKDTFFYIDPPYWDCEDYYGKGLFSKEDFTKLRDLLRGLKGKWLVSINDAPEIRALFAEFTIEQVATKYSVNDAAPMPVTELLIRNYELLGEAGHE